MHVRAVAGGCGGCAPGFVAGFLGSVAERTLFSARESWKQARQSGRFLLHQIQTAFGQGKIRCPECLSPDQEAVDANKRDRLHPTLDFPIEIETLLIYQCRECEHVWEKVLYTKPYESEGE